MTARFLPMSRHWLAAVLLLQAPLLQAQTAADFSPGARFAARDGATLYATACLGCHMPGGKGAAGAAKYPALAGNDRLASAGYATFMVLRGQKAMPGFSEQLSDAQIAAVVNYVRSGFGNAWTDRVSAADASALRQTTAPLVP